MATLAGHSLPAAVAPWWDHTYVTSDQGHVWPCWGRAAGGAEICSGFGDTAFADCLSQPSSQAGLRYGVTGVCHQTANRILFPAQQLVDRAKGYNVSVFQYGTYGRGTWAELERCANLRGGTPQPTLGNPGAQMSKPSRLLTLTIEALRDITAKTFGLPQLPTEDQVRRAEFRAIWETQLGKDFAPDQREAVSEIQAKMREELDELRKVLDEGHLSRVTFLDASTGIVDVTLDRCEDLLGREKFQRLFGGSAREAARTLVDPVVFFAQEAAARR